MTYYDYFNIFFRNHPPGGFFNQFVPQLHLGNVLANSTNAPYYQPIWKILNEWHIGSQYFFALLCNSNDDNDVQQQQKRGSSSSNNNNNNPNPCWKAHAATGKLIRVQPGEVIETIFELVEISKNDWEWHLRMGVVGSHPSRWSIVVVKEPYMGLLDNNNNTTTSKWQDDHYTNVTVGSCLENYGMINRNNFPQTWEIEMDIIMPPTMMTAQQSSSYQQQQHNNSRRRRRDFVWDDWISTGGGDDQRDDKCSWLPHCTIKNVQGGGGGGGGSTTWQRATWNATLPPQPQEEEEEQQQQPPQQQQQQQKQHYYDWGAGS